MVQLLEQETVKQTPPERVPSSRPALKLAILWTQTTLFADAKDAKALSKSGMPADLISHILSLSISLHLQLFGLALGTMFCKILATKIQKNPSSSYISHVFQVETYSDQDTMAYFPACCRKQPVGSVGSSSLPKRHKQFCALVTACHGPRL